MHKILNTSWVTVLTLIALLLSSVASGASLMPLQMATNHQMVMVEESVESHCDPVIQIEMEQAKVKHKDCCGSESMFSDHQCCPSSCVSTYSVIPEPAFDSFQPHSLVLISNQPSAHTSAIASALFRPPIA